MFWSLLVMNWQKNHPKFTALSPFSTWPFFSRKQAKSECDLIARTNLPSGRNWLEMKFLGVGLNFSNDN